MSEHQESAEDERERGVYAVIRSYERIAREGHDRHRKILDGFAERQQEIEERMQKVESAQENTKTMFDTFERRKVEVSSIRFTPTTVMFLLALCASIVGGQKWSTSGLSGQITDIKAEIDALKMHDEDYVKLQDERMAQIVRDIGEVKTRQAALDLTLTDFNITRRRQPQP
jgi:hypothetical protein